MIEFKKRSAGPHYQLRFWTKPETHAAFAAACKKEGLLMQDVLNDFLDWFIAYSASDSIKKVEEHD